MKYQLEDVDRVRAAAAEALERSSSGIRMRPRSIQQPHACLLLLVEDDVILAAMVADIARQEGLDPLYARDLKTAALLLAQHDVRRAVVDWVLTDGRARFLLAMLRAKGIDRVIYTGHADDEDVREEMARGERVIVKPGIAELRDWMRRRHTRETCGESCCVVEKQADPED